MKNRAYIIIDCWITVQSPIVTHVVRTVAHHANSPVILANYSDHIPIHPLLTSTLQHRNYYRMRENIEHLKTILVRHNIDQVCIMGAHWPACTHYSQFGLYALQQLQATVPFDIVVYPQCLEHLGENRAVTPDDLYDCLPMDDYYLVPKTTPLEL